MDAKNVKKKKLSLYDKRFRNITVGSLRPGMQLPHRMQD